ncbi:MAG: nucleoside triphosphate pyrophosphohydrolase [Anaerovoracaceae bacterium]|jgi:tetrapyrrole methylase family protein/MazG family protein
MKIKEQYRMLTEPAPDESAAIARLDEIVRILRVQCPWDREQDHRSLRGALIEEAYEAADAIDRGDAANLREELGDVLLQVVFHAELAREEKDYDLTAVINEECEKMIRRHPHVFSDENLKTVDKILEKWENIKSAEHGEQTAADHLQAVPRALPALIRSRKVQKRAADAGLDWDDVSGSLDKLAEESQELKEACRRGEKEAMTEELGDLLFSVVNVSRFMGISPEEALTKATDKFIRRFARVEELAAASGRPLRDLDPDTLDVLWEKAKNDTRSIPQTQ